MKKKRQLPTFLIFILAISMTRATYRACANDKDFALASSSNTVVSVSPPNITLYLEIGKTFTINITITNATDLYVWQAGMSFTASVLEALSFEEGPFLNQKGATLWTSGTIDNIAGIIHYHACALAGNVIGVNGNGTLGTMRFRVRDYGNSTLQLIDVILLDSNLSDIERTLIHSTIRIKMIGDVNGDRIVDAFDLFALGKTYDSDPSSPNWNQDCDFNRDNKIDSSDLIDISNHYGRTA